MLNQIMLDIETLGNRPTSAIIAIGAAAFNFGSDEKETFYVNVSGDSCIDLGCTTDDSTLKWWKEQNEEAQKVLTAKDALPLPEALDLFTKWLVKIRKQAPKMELNIWGNDNTFDIVITENAFSVCDMAFPWNFWESRSVRTLVFLGQQCGIDPKKTIKRKGVHHNAVDDSLHQIEYCKAIIDHITGTKSWT